MTDNVMLTTARGALEITRRTDEQRAEMRVLPIPLGGVILEVFIEQIHKTRSAYASTLFRLSPEDVATLVEALQRTGRPS
jgi:hypothetical protein